MGKRVDRSTFTALSACKNNGYSVFPTKYGQKLPAIKGYSRFSQERPSTSDLDHWDRSFPNCGFTLAGGSRFGYLVLDVDIVWCSELSKKAFELLENLIGGPFPYRVGRSPKWAALVGCVHPWPSRKVHPVEIFGTSGHTIAHGIHPDTSKPYQWFRGSPDQIPVSDLPQVDEKILTQFLLGVDKLLNATTSPKSPSKNIRTTQRTLSLTRSKLSLERKGKRGSQYGQVIKDQLNNMTKGNRSDTLISVVSSLLARGYSKPQIIKILDAPYLQRWEGDGRHGLSLLEEMIDRVSQNIRGGMWKN